MKRSNSESDLLAPLESNEGDSELAKTFRRVRKKSTDDTCTGELLGPYEPRHVISNNVAF